MHIAIVAVAAIGIQEEVKYREILIIKKLVETAANILPFLNQLYFYDKVSLFIAFLRSSASSPVPRLQ